MVKVKHETVEEVIKKVGEDQKPVLERLRLLVKATVPTAAETVRRERITYTLGGRDFSGIRPTKQHVDLLFFKAQTLSSTKLEGQGTLGDPKHIKVTTLKNFNQAEAERLLREAAANVQVAPA